MKKKMGFRWIALLVVISLASPVAAAGKKDDPFADRKAERMAGDLLVVRPLGVVGTVLGSVLFVLSLPFSALGGNTEEAAQKLVVDPATYTFKRPLGEVDVFSLEGFEEGP